MASLLQTSLRPQCAQCRLTHQIRHATLLKRPRRPYTFTQIITLSDGSTFLHRTTSPAPIYKSTKDTKNNPLWNPSSQKLLNVEEDEAGRLRMFRKRFGRGFDMEAVSGEGAREGADGGEQQQDESSLDLIGSFWKEATEKKGAAAAGKGESAAKSGKGKGGQK